MENHKETLNNCFYGLYTMRCFEILFYVLFKNSYKNNNDMLIFLAMLIGLSIDYKKFTYQTLIDNL